MTYSVLKVPLNPNQPTNRVTATVVTGIPAWNFVLFLPANHWLLHTKA